ncbi:MAG TPA: hypothetical protein VN969_45865 [Streptosporangiaceae bacterium]|nr:hypothetical protein [Streptosporangiaceae bacterium]
MISLATPALSEPERSARPQLRSWRTAVGATAVAAGAVITTGAFLPWVSAFAGLIQVPGVRGLNGRILAAAGVVIAITGVCHLVRDRRMARWLIGAFGFGSLAFSGYLLLQLTRSVSVLGGDSMVVARGGPGLWFAAAGSAAAFATLFLPPSTQTTLRRRDGRRDGGPDAVRQVIAWAADRESAGARRWLQIALGAVWLLDAALQFQPYMFGRSFITQQLMPATMGNPAVIADPAMLVTRVLSHDPAAWNSLFATIQLALAAGLLWRRTAKAALAGTVVWALFVWWLGEGLGSVLTGTATPLTGAPGAVVLYALIAVLAWPSRRTGDSPASIAAASPLGIRWARASWLVLWASFAYLVLQPPERAARGLQQTLAGNAAGEPGWLAAVDRAAAAAAGSRGTIGSVVLAVIFLLIAAGIFHPATTRAAVLLAVVTALAIWVVGENFGGIFTGQGTDPDTGPLLILLAAAFWPLPAASGSWYDNSSLHANPSLSRPLCRNWATTWRAKTSSHARRTDTGGDCATVGAGGAASRTGSGPHGRRPARGAARTGSGPHGVRLQRADLPRRARHGQLGRRGPGTPGHRARRR